MKARSGSASVLLSCLAFLSPDAGATVIVGDVFGGSSGAPLNGTTASTFGSAVTAAGGNGTWTAHSVYNANGTLTSTSGVSPNNTQTTSAVLGLGSYIWDTRGTANGLFTLTATFSEVTGGSSALVARWVSLGFFSAQPTTTQAFYNGNGMATVVHRQSDTGTNYFAGPLTGGSSDPGAITGTVTFTITLDLRSWNGAGNYGSVTFTNSVTGVSTTANLSNDAGVNRFQYVGFSGNTESATVVGPAATISNFSLSQIPEPGSAALAALGLTALLRRRRA